MTVEYAVTFEFDLKPPITHRGTVAGSSAATVVKRALKEATAAHPGLSWSSLVIVLLGRVQESETGRMMIEDEMRTAMPCYRHHCGGFLVSRMGTYGEFYGCTNYPHCPVTMQAHDAKNIIASRVFGEDGDPDEPRFE